MIQKSVSLKRFYNTFKYILIINSQEEIKVEMRRYKTDQY